MSEAPDTTAVDEEELVSPEGPPDDRIGELDEGARERRAAALAQIRTFGDPVLKSRASEITGFGPELEREAERMIELMHDAIGVGLAATQLGVMHRLLVFQAGLDATPTAVANPEGEWASDELATAEEGCLSLPRGSVDVEPPVHARISRRAPFRARPLPDRRRQRSRGGGADALREARAGRGLRLRPADQGPPPVRARDAERAPVAAAAVARRGPDRAGDHGRGRHDR